MWLSDSAPTRNTCCALWFSKLGHIHVEAFIIPAPVVPRMMDLANGLSLSMLFLHFSFASQDDIQVESNYLTFRHIQSMPNAFHRFNNQTAFVDGS